MITYRVERCVNVLISTYWNVNKDVIFSILKRKAGFNLNLLECKCNSP